MTNRVEKLGEMVQDNLIANLNVKIITATAVISSGAGKLVRGTILALSGSTAGTGEFVPLGTTAQSNETLTANCILAEDVDASTADAVAEVYVAGCFNKNALTVNSGYTMSAADIQDLRKGGIYLETAAN